jgi:hypothetical protein
MHFPTLAAQSDLPSEVMTIIDELLRRKALTHELGVGAMPQIIGAIIDSEFSLPRELWPDGAGRGDLERRDVACRFFGDGLKKIVSDRPLRDAYTRFRSSSVPVEPATGDARQLRQVRSSPLLLPRCISCIHNADWISDRPPLKVSTVRLPVAKALNAVKSDTIQRRQ